MKLIDKFKNRLFNTEVFNKTQNETNFLNALNNHKIGDVIWANRYDFDWDKEGISEGHEVGPYIIVGKENDKLICLYCTSHYDRRYTIELSDYKFFHKKTFAKKYKLKVVDSESYYINNYYYNNNYLTEEDTNKIIKSLVYSPYEGIFYYDFGLVKSFEMESEIELDERDVVFHNNHYSLIINKTAGDLLAISFNDYNCVTSNINFDKVTFNFKNRYIINPNRVEYINTITEKQFEVVKKRYNEYLNKKELVDNKVLKRGAIIKIGYSFYYVYHSDGYKSKIFNLKNVLDENENTINFNTYNYLLNFEDEKEIDNKKCTYFVLGYLDDNTMDYISNKKKSFNKKKSNDNKKEESKNLSQYEFCSVIESSKLYSLRYLVLYTIEDKIVTISLDSFLVGSIRFKEFDINDESIFLSTKVASDEIKKVKSNLLKINAIKEEKQIEDRKLIKKK